MKKLNLLLVLMLCIFVFTGCHSNKENQITIYTSMTENQIQEMKKQLKDKFSNLSIAVQYVSTGSSAAKIKNEGENIEADIVLDLETSHMVDVSDKFANLDKIDKSIYLDNVIKSDNYLPWVKYTMNIIIDKKYFNEHKLTIPETYEELLKPEYKGLIAMPDPKTSGTGYAFYLNAVNIMGEEKAIEYFKNLKNNLREFSISGSGPTNLLKQGEIAIAMGMTSQGVRAINEGYEFEIITLETGSPYNTTSCGVIKGKENKEHVMEVFQWLINDYGKYDKENFMPDIILKNQEIKMKNYPKNLKDADMKDIDSTTRKEDLLNKWSKING